MHIIRLFLYPHPSQQALLHSCLQEKTCFPSVETGGYFADGLYNTEAVLRDESIRGAAGLQKVYGFIAGETPSEFVPVTANALYPLEHLYR